MKERGIIFSGQSVPLIRAGTKTQTRRVVKEQPRWSERYGVWTTLTGALPLPKDCPYGTVGDRLWVRETWAAVWPDVDGPYSLDECTIEYRADTGDPYPGGWPEEYARGSTEAPKWRSPYYMPRRFSRALLEILEVRVQWLQEITEEDARAEGVTEAIWVPAWRRAWDAVNAKRGFPWEKNPLVWAITFRRLGDR